MDKVEQYLSYLPKRLGDEIREISRGRMVEEIRLRRGLPLSITISSGNLRGKGCMNEEEAEQILYLVCQGSLHAHTETLCQGYVTLPCGARVSLVGKATVVDKRVQAVRDITSICFRIPRDVRGDPSAILSYLKSTDYCAGILLFSLPGIGKTTMLRQLAISLSSPPHLRRVAVIDSRSEIGAAGDFRGCLCDFLYDYPKAKGIEIAIRTLSPQILICDEIGGEEEAREILDAYPCGVPLIASVHGRDVEEVICREGISVLVKRGVFGRIYEIKRDANGANLMVRSEFERERIL